MRNGTICLCECTLTHIYGPYQLHFTVVIKSALSFSKPHLVGIVRQSSNRWGFCAFSLAWKTLPSIRFNWKVMKFLFKAVTHVYGDHLLGETGLPYLSVVFTQG